MIVAVLARLTKMLATAAASLVVLSVGSAQAFPGVPNTGPGANPSGFGHVSAGPTLGRLLGLPFDPAGPTTLPTLLSPATPENDLAAALAAMAAATSATDAAAARRRALDILEGNEGNPALADRAYEGFGLLNWKVKSQQVAANGTVTIRQIRWGEHVISDTWLLDFADPASPYSIRYEVVELGQAFGGELNPTPLLRNGTTVIGGQHSAIQPLAVEGNQDIGTTQSSRFTIARELGAVPEQTRSGVQAVTVAMPPPNVTSAILDPNLRAGHEAVAALKPATAAEIAAARDAMGIANAVPTEADKLAAIAKLADESPEKQIWSQLRSLGELAPAADLATEAAYLSAANSAGAANTELVGAMRARGELPAGVDPGTADITVVLQNNEAYVSRTQLRLAPGAQLQVRVVNRDEISHHISALDLHDRTRILGATDWGQFDWSDLPGGPQLAPNSEGTFTLSLAAKSFELWVGDLGSGDQAGAAIAIDREIKQDAIGFGAGSLPIHAVPDAAGDMWVVLLGTDTIARVRPAADLAGSAVDRYPLPGGRHEVDSPIAPLAPADIIVDGHGILWATLSSGNSIVRIDPALVQPGTSNGMRILALDPCPTSGTPACKPEVPPIPNEQPTRRPTRLKSYIDGRGNTVLWFVEAGFSRVGVMRVDESGTQLNQTHFPCGCEFPESIDLGPDGSVWFSEVFENRIGRVTPDPVAPFSASAASIDHFNIPHSVEVMQPPLADPVQTSLPLSLAVDGRGRVWFSQSSLSGIAFLDPAAAVPGTTAGFTELHAPTPAKQPLPTSDFRSAAAPADVMTDRANNLWWSGEYGDQIEQLTPSGAQGLRFRGSVRRGLTEGPVSDAAGNLWVVEAGGNLLTRISGVTRGVLRPFGLPASYEADTTSDSITGSRLPDDVSSVQVRVERQNAVVATATVPVAGGEFDVSGADWQGATADPVRPDDTVRIQTAGPFARAPLSFGVAALAGAVRADGSIAGTALSGTRALPDRVVVTAGGVTSSAPVNGGDGAWSITPAAPLPQDAALRFAWSGANVAGTFRTVTRVAGTEPQQPPPPGPAPAPPADVPAQGAAPATATPGATPTTTAPTPAATKPATPCASRRWLYGSRRRPSVLLLRLTRTQVTGCLGKPSTKTAARARRLERWTYGRGLELHFRAGRVIDYNLRDGRFKTSGHKAGIGSPLTTLRRDLPGLRRDRRRGLQRALLRRSDGRFADIRVRTSKSGKILQIGVSLKTRTGLDGFGRSLLRGKGAAS